MYPRRGNGMDDVKRTKAEEKVYAELLTGLAAQERWLRGFRDAGGSLPAFGVNRSNAAEPEDVEIEIDVDVAKWFKALGPLHLARMNAVLRVYARDFHAREACRDRGEAG